MNGVTQMRGQSAVQEVLNIKKQAEVGKLSEVGAGAFTSRSVEPAKKKGGKALSLLSFQTSSVVKVCLNNHQSTRPQISISEPNFNGCRYLHIYGMTDGLGKDGVQVSIFVSNLLVSCLKEGLKNINEGKWRREEIIDVVMGSFEVTGGKLISSGLDCRSSGCTCLISIIYFDMIITASSGDIRAIIGANYLDGFVVQSLSQEHTESNSGEQKRVKNFIQKTSLLGRELPEEMDTRRLPLTRSFGCTDGLRLGMIWYPEIKTFKLTPYDSLLLIGSQAVFRLISNKQILELANDEISKGISLNNTAEKIRVQLQNKRRPQVAPDQLTFILVQLK